MKYRTSVGQLVFACGIAVAVCAGAKLPEPATPRPQPTVAGEVVTPSVADAPIRDSRRLAERFPDTLPAFAAGVGMAVVGLVLWRTGRRTGSGDATPSRGEDPGDPLRILQQLQQPLAQLSAAAGRLPRASLLHALDDVHQQYVMPLTEARQRVIDRRGMSAGAEVLVTAAVGERMLNRAWSAAADGHLPEALAALQEAVDAFHAAARLAEREP